MENNNLSLEELKAKRAEKEGDAEALAADLERLKEQRTALAEERTEGDQEAIESNKKEIKKHFSLAEGARAIENREGMLREKMTGQPDEPREETEEKPPVGPDRPRGHVIDSLEKEIAAIIPEYEHLTDRQKTIAKSALENRLYTHTEEEARKRFDRHLDSSKGTQRLLSKLLKNTMIGAYEKQVYAELGGDVSRNSREAAETKEAYKEAKENLKNIPKEYKKAYEDAVKEFNKTNTFTTSDEIEEYLQAQNTYLELKKQQRGTWETIKSKLPEPFSSIWKKTDASLINAEVELNRENFLKDKFTDVVQFIDKQHLDTAHDNNGKPLFSDKNTLILDYANGNTLEHIPNSLTSALQSFNIWSSEFAAKAPIEYQTAEATKKQQAQYHELMGRYHGAGSHLFEELKKYAHEQKLPIKPEAFAEQQLAQSMARVETMRLLTTAPNAHQHIEHIEKSNTLTLGKDIAITKRAEQNRLGRAGKIQQGARTIAGMGDISRHVERLDEYLSKNDGTEKPEGKILAHALNAVDEKAFEKTRLLVNKTADHHEQQKLVEATKKIVAPKLKELETELKTYKATQEVVRELEKTLHKLHRQKEILDADKKAAGKQLKETHLLSVHSHTINKTYDLVHHVFEAKNKEYLEHINELATRVEFMTKKYEAGQMNIGTDPNVQFEFFAKLNRAKLIVQNENTHQEHLAHNQHHHAPRLRQTEYVRSDDGKIAEVHQQYTQLNHAGLAPDIYTKGHNLGEMNGFPENRIIKAEHNVRNMLSLDNNKYRTDEKFNDSVGIDPHSEEPLVPGNRGVGQAHQERVRGGTDQYDERRRAKFNETRRSTGKRMSGEEHQRIEERAEKKALVTIEKYLPGGVTSPEWELFLKDIPAKDFLSDTMSEDLQPLYRPLREYVTQVMKESSLDYKWHLADAEEHFSTYDFLKFIFAGEEYRDHTY